MCVDIIERTGNDFIYFFIFFPSSVISKQISTVTITDRFSLTTHVVDSFMAVPKNRTTLFTDDFNIPTRPIPSPLVRPLSSPPRTVYPPYTSLYVTMMRIIIVIIIIIIVASSLSLSAFEIRLVGIVFFSSPPAGVQWIANGRSYA